VPIPSPEHFSILKGVPSKSEISRSNTASPSDVVSDSSGCAIKVDSKSGRPNDRKIRKDKGKKKHTDKDESTQSSASEGTIVETVDKSVKFKLKKSKN